MIKEITLFSLATILLSGCGTIVNGSHQAVGIMSHPGSANVLVDNFCMGKTPLIVEMSRSNNHLVRIELDGYEPYEVFLTKKMSGWVFGNLLFGGIFGVAIDAVSGGLYVLTPNQIRAEMGSCNVTCSKNIEESFIGVVLEPKPEWEKIGNLTPMQKG